LDTNTVQISSAAAQCWQNETTYFSSHVNMIKLGNVDCFSKVHRRSSHQLLSMTLVSIWIANCQ